MFSWDDVNLLISVLVPRAFAGRTNRKERLLIVYQACSTCVRNTYCLVKDYK